MTKKPVSNVGASIRQRLLNLRVKTGEDAQALFTQFAIERFLCRLSRSGFGDAITPAAEEHTYPVLVDMAAPKLLMYPVETVVAEKLEAAVKLGMINSRMKDFYDLLVIFRRFPCDEGTLTRAIAETFARRGTLLPRTVPPGLSDEFGSDPAANRRWREFLTRMQLANEPTDFAEVVRTVREGLWPTIMAAGRPSA